MAEMKINDLIFKELIKRGYSLEGNTRVWNIADSKLWYLTSKQAQAYLDLERSKDYSKQLFKAELDMLKKHMPEISEKSSQRKRCQHNRHRLRRRRKKAIIPIDVLHKKIQIRYCPVDISSYMVSKAIKRASKLEKGEVVHLRWNISDFDNVENIASLLRDNTYRQNLFLFLGDTLSNFEVHEVLYEIVEAMNTGQDYLVVGLSLNNKKPNELVKPYKKQTKRPFPKPNTRTTRF